MCENPGDSSDSEEFNDDYGVILGFWDHEKTPTVIKDLEGSLSCIENKCKKLLEELIYYQQYWIDINDDSPTSSHPLPEKTKNLQSKSTSFPDIAYRKNVICSEKFKETFHEKFEEKLSIVNRKLLEVTSKLGLKDNLFLFETKDYVEKLKEKARGNVKKYLHKIEKGFLNTYLSENTKSNPAIFNGSETKKHSKISKISKSEWEFYQKLSKVSLSKKRSKKGGKKKKKIHIIHKPLLSFTKHVKNINHLEKKTLMGHSEGNSFQSVQNSSQNSLTDVTQNTSKHSVSDKANKFSLSKSHSSFSSNFSKKNIHKKSKRKTKANALKLNLKDLDLDEMCNNLAIAIQEKNSFKKKLKKEKIKEVLPKVHARSRKDIDLERKFHQTLPLKNCKNSDSQNKLNSSEAHLNQIESESIQFNNKSLTSKISQERNELNSPYIVTTYPWSPKENTLQNSSNDTKNPSHINSGTNSNNSSTSNNSVYVNYFESHEINNVENEDIWMSKNRTPPFNQKHRSRYTKTTPNSLVRYHESTTEYYTTGKEAIFKSNSKTETIVLPDYKKTDIGGITKHIICGDASGDNSCEKKFKKKKMDWFEIVNLFSHLCRSYLSLKDAAHTEGNISDPVVKSLESEIEYAMQKYREFLEIYCKFLELKGRLKSIKYTGHNECLIQGSSWLCSNYEKKVNSLKPTNTMVLRKAMKQVQILQDKIKLLNDF